MFNVRVGVRLQHLEGCLVALVSQIDVYVLLLYEQTHDLHVRLGNSRVQCGISWYIDVLVSWQSAVYQYF